LDYKKHFANTNSNDSHLDHLELLINSNIVAPEDGELQKIVLDARM